MQRPFEISSDLYPFESHWMQIDGMNVHYLDEGPKDGPVIVLCHGNPSWSLLYVPIMRRLREKFRCIAVDYPGFGMSEKPPFEKYDHKPQSHSKILGEAVDRLVPGTFSIFVQDWGGPIGLNMAADRADRVEKVIIGNTWAWPPNLDTEAGQNMKAFSDRMGGDDMRERTLTKNSFVKMCMGQLTFGYKRNAPELANQVKDAYMAPFETEASRIGTWVFPRSIFQEGEWLKQLEAKLAPILEKPVLLFWGEADPVFPEPVRKAWEKKLKNYRLVLLPEANHFFQQDEPEKITEEMLAFL